MCDLFHDVPIRPGCPGSTLWRGARVCCLKEDFFFFFAFAIAVVFVPLIILSFSRMVGVAFVLF